MLGRIQPQKFRRTPTFRNPNGIMKTLVENLDRERIRSAVAEAETRTAGEIVPFIVPQSDDYEISVWRGAAALALLGITAALLTIQFYQGWGLGWLYTPWGMALVALGGGVAGALLGGYVGPVRRAFAGSDLLDRTVHRAAMHAFVEEEVFSTRDRTGILIYVSLLEHRIEVLGDTGINAKVSPDEWIDVVKRIRRGIKNENLTEGLVDAIETCGHLLERSGVEIRPDDENELANRVRTPGIEPDSQDRGEDGPADEALGDDAPGDEASKRDSGATPESQDASKET